MGLVIFKGGTPRFHDAAFFVLIAALFVAAPPRSRLAPITQVEFCRSGAEPRDQNSQKNCGGRRPEQFLRYPHSLFIPHSPKATQIYSIENASTDVVNQADYDQPLINASH
jgi:hypothetical protein